ncbi:MAG: hypothetical protein ACREJC_23180 [Tepidisphaeraceae bacterium]
MGDLNMDNSEQTNPQPIDHEIEATLRRHLSTELDGRLGLSGARFLREINGNGGHVHRARLSDSTWRHSRGALLGLFGSAVAAALALFIAHHATFKAVSQPSPQQQSEIQLVDNQPPVEGDVTWNTIDEGTVELADGSQARSLLRQRLDRVQYFDKQKNALVEYTVPHEERVLIGLTAH